MLSRTSNRYTYMLSLLLIAGCSQSSTTAGPSTLTSVALSTTATPTTPAQTSGPFYPDLLPSEQDADLRSNGGKVAQGSPIRIFGEVKTPRGEPIAGATIELWQTDHKGIYLHSQAPSQNLRDPSFQGYGQSISNLRGEYQFDTIHPSRYPGRTPHLHFRIHTPQGATLTTQLYFPDESSNSHDGIYLTSGDNAERLLLTDRGKRDGIAHYQYTFILNSSASAP